MALAKIALHQFGSSLRDAQVGAHVAHQLVRRCRAGATERVGFHILVEQFIGIQFRAVRRQAEDADLFRVRGQPALHGARLVHRVAIHDEKYLPPTLPRQAQQPAEKIQKYPRGEPLTKNHEGQPSAIGNRRNHVAAKTLSRAEHHRGLPAASVAASRLMVRTQAHLIQPMNLRPKLPRGGANRGILFRQPFAHRHGILFVRAAHRLLRGQSPGAQITSYRPHRNLQRELAQQQLLHRFPGPQRKGQQQLLRASADYVAYGGGRLMRRQTRTRWSPATARAQSPPSHAFQQTHPAADGTARHAEDPRRLRLRKTLRDGFDHAPAQVLLTFRRQRASIRFFHARYTNTLFPECHLYYAPISKSEIDSTSANQERLRDLAKATKNGVREWDEKSICIW